jgi:hypothetical protein
VSTDQISQSSSLEYSLDESALVLTSPECVVINTLKIPSDLLAPIVDVLLKDASRLFDLISDYPLPNISSFKGIIHSDDSTQSSDWVKVKSGMQYTILDSASQNPCLFLVQYRSGRATVTIDTSNQELTDQRQLVTTEVDYRQLTEIGETIATREIISAVTMGDQRRSIDDLQFHDESLVSRILVRSKALGDHVLCANYGDGFNTNNCSFIGCFALMDLLLVAEGDVKRAKRLLDLAAERATLVRDYIDLAWAAEMLQCSRVVIDALARRAMMALRNDDRNSPRNLPCIPELAELCCSRVTGGDELALELLSELLVAESDPSTLRKGAEIASNHLNNSELAHNLSETAVRISRDHA